MKPILISSTITLIIGFSFGWLFKSSSQEIEDTPKLITQNSNQNNSTSPADNNTPPGKPSRPISNNPDRTLRTDPYIPTTSDAKLEAKWLHLSETLSLTPEQNKTLAAIIEKNHPDNTGETSLQDAISTAGKNLEASILSSLTPEQQKKFKDLQNRNLQNQLSAKAMRFYSDELADLDLTPQQREQALETLTLEYQQQAESIPNSTRLLLSGSFLPVTGNTIADDGFLLLDNLVKTIDPQQIAEARRTEIQNKSTRFQNILTPAQLQIYQQKVQESLNNLQQIFPH
jgi:DNA-binding MarR family transcriptional regulator